MSELVIEGLGRTFPGVKGGKPTVEVTTPDGTVHRLWRVASAEIIGTLRTLFAPKKLHVLDGHARYEGMLAHAAKLGAESHPQYASTHYGLACLVNLEDPALGWTSLVKGRLEVRVMPGEHLSMQDEAHTRAFAEILRELVLSRLVTPRAARSASLPGD